MARWFIHLTLTTRPKLLAGSGAGNVYFGRCACQLGLADDAGTGLVLGSAWAQRCRQVLVLCARVSLVGRHMGHERVHAAALHGSWGCTVAHRSWHWKGSHQVAWEGACTGHVWMLPASQVVPIVPLASHIQ